MRAGVYRQLGCLALLVSAWSGVARAELPPLKVSDNHRFLVTSDRKPFFYLADTAWELFHRLNREEAELYLKDRAGKRFNVVQACMLAEFGGLTVPNAYGHLPLANNDPAKPNEDYFNDIDWVIDKAAEQGLYVGLLPTWGDKVNKKWGQGPEVFNPQNAAIYGEFLGKRYKQKPIIWILGGDRPIEGDRHMAIWRAMAEGIRKGDGGVHLITFHPMGGRSSSEWLQKEPWLDFNMLQSGHAARDISDWGMIWNDYQKEPIKPTLDGEANYEDHPINWKAENGYFNEFDVRKQSYFAVFAGACGQTYGCHDVWQFYQPGREPVSQARTDWKEALKLPAASQMQYLRALMESRPYLTRVPDQSLLKSPEGKDGDHCQATRDSAGSYAMVYIPDGRPVTLDLTKLTGQKLKAWWYDPREGGANPAGQFDNAGTREFMPPAPAKAGEANDWVLVIDDASRQFPAPGK
ncbi:MAG TPA: glycoside hydrolase family 140 protein [Tepidisphaeraceae bacterium]|nr:glycoside hydrolase family 140 protein [Tepidisphaeraceae bacterium]